MHLYFFFPDVNVYESVIDPNMFAYNPYPTLGAPKLPSWPRGFPLNLVKVPMPEIEPVPPESKTKFAVLQSLADIEPDVDAIFRLTHETPFAFKRGKNQFNCQKSGYEYY